MKPPTLLAVRAVTRPLFQYSEMDSPGRKPSPTIMMLVPGAPEPGLTMSRGAPDGVVVGVEAAGVPVGATGVCVAVGAGVTGVRVAVGAGVTGVRVAVGAGAVGVAVAGAPSTVKVVLACWPVAGFVAETLREPGAALDESVAASEKAPLLRPTWA